MDHHQINSLVFIKELESVVSKLPRKKTLGASDFTGEF